MGLVYASDRKVQVLTSHPVSNTAERPTFPRSTEYGLVTTTTQIRPTWVIQIATRKADDLYIEKVFSTEENIPMLELQRSTARRMIGRTVQVACVDGQLVDGHIDWCSDEEIAVAN